jgi:hypothetical protein
VIRVRGGNVVQLFCANYREYLILPNSVGFANYGQLQTIFTFFCAIRLDPLTLFVDIGDLTFSSTEGAVAAWNSLDRVAFGFAGDCTVVGVARAGIDLRSTPFAIDESARWMNGGYLPTGNWSVHTGRQVASIFGGGNCGWSTPGMDSGVGNTCADYQWAIPLRIANDIEGLNLAACQIPPKSSQTTRCFASRVNPLPPITGCPVEVKATPDPPATQTTETTVLTTTTKGKPPTVVTTAMPPTPPTPPSPTITLPIMQSTLSTIETTTPTTETSTATTSTATTSTATTSATTTSTATTVALTSAPTLTMTTNETTTSLVDSEIAPEAIDVGASTVLIGGLVGGVVGLLLLAALVVGYVVFFKRRANASKDHHPAAAAVAPSDGYGLIETPPAPRTEHASPSVLNDSGAAHASATDYDDPSILLSSA